MRDLPRLPNLSRFHRSKRVPFQVCSLTYYDKRSGSPIPNLSMYMARLHFVSYSMKQSMCVVLPSLPIDLLCVAGETGDCKAGTGGRRSSSNCSSLSTTYRRDRRALASPPLTLCRRNRGHSFRKVYKAMGTLCKQQQQQEGCGGSVYVIIHYKREI